MCRPDLKPTGAHGVSGSHGQWVGYRGKEEAAPFGCWRWSSRSSLPKCGKGGSRTHPTETQPARLSHAAGISHCSADCACCLAAIHTTPPAAPAPANGNVSGESLCFQISCPLLQALGEAGSLQAVERLPAARANRNSISQGCPWQTQALQFRLFL